MTSRVLSVEVADPTRGIRQMDIPRRLGGVFRGVLHVYHNRSTAVKTRPSPLVLM